MSKNIFGIDDLLPLLATAPTDGRSRDRSEKRIERAFEQGSVAKARRMLIEAIRLDPGHTKASAILIEDWPIEEKIQVTRELLRIERESLGAKTFKEGEGHFWGLFETRPFMRRLITLFDLLRRAGDTRSAIACAEESLRLCTSDNVGARGPLLGLYLAEKNYEAAKALLEAHPEDMGATLSWGRVLFFIACDQEEAAKQAVERAMEFSPLAAATLIFRETHHDVVDRLERYNEGSMEEAMIVQSELDGASTAHPEFSEWLRELLLPDYVDGADWERALLDYESPENGQPIPYDALREALKRGPAAVPALMRMLEHTIRSERIIPSDLAPFSTHFILLLLGEIGSAGLIEAVHRLYRCHPRHLDPLEDYTTGQLAPSLVNALGAAAKEGCLDEALGQLEAFLADERCEEYARWGVASGLRDAVSAGHVPPENAMEIVRRWFDNASPNFGYVVRYGVCDLCATLGWESFRPEVEYAFAAALIETHGETEEELLARFSETRVYRKQEVDTIKTIQCLEEIEADLLRVQQKAKSWSEFDRNVPARTGPKIGRNEPCPCGSGKKYKKCCL